MNSLVFLARATLAAPIKSVRINSRRAPDREPKAIRGLPRGIVLVALAGALGFCGVVSGAEAPLTLAEAQRRAIERSLQIPAQDAAVTASREMAVAAGQLPDPVLRLGVDNLPINGPDQFSVGRDFMTMRRIGVMQEFTRSEKRQLRAQRFERQAEKSRAEKTATIASIQRDTALAWLDRYYDEAIAAVIAEQATEVKLEIVAAESAYRAGRGSQADVFAAHSTLAALDDRASEFNRRISSAKAVLARWVGESAEAPLEGTPAFDSIRLDTGALEADLAHHPQLTVLRKQEEIASTEARIAQADKKADWSVEVTYSQRGSSFSNMVSVGVSIPLQWDQRNRQDRELASKLATADQARAEREEALRAHIGEVRAMVAEWENGRERLTRYERQLIPLAKERTKAAFGAYRGGKTSLTDLLLARRNEIDMRMQALQLEMETARLWAQLNFLFPVEGNAPHAASPSTAASTKESK
ncbi:MAG: TolC family protein [Betaproteobacteria bacterium]|nr:TolC family protein [Betaproteobacteria bacterium]